MIDWNAERDELVKQKEAMQARAEAKMPPKTHILADRIELPPNVTLRMCEAGMKEWDAAHAEGVRHWPTMLGRVYAAMTAASKK